jgi:hypothetical protein
MSFNHNTNIMDTCSAKELTTNRRMRSDMKRKIYIFVYGKKA